MSSDIVVVGAGVVGCAVADFLARDGHRVSVFDAVGIAAGASGRSAGLVEHPYDGAQEALYGETVRLLADLLGTGMPNEPVGVLLLTDHEAAAHRLVTTHATFASLRSTLLAPEDLRTIEPLLAERTWGCLLRTGYPVDPAAATNALADRARSHGAQFHLGDAVSLAWDHDACIGVQCGGKRFHADTVVIAAGAQSGQLVDPAGGWQPIRPLWGVSATLRIDPPPRHVLLEGTVASIQVGGTQTDDAAFSLIPTADSVALGSTFLMAKPRGEDWVSRMLSRGSRFYAPLGAADVRHVTVCARPSSFDGRPLIGKVPQAQRLWIAAGHGGRGISTGAASARLLAEAIAADDEGVIPALLRASRVTNPPNLGGMSMHTGHEHDEEVLFAYRPSDISDAEARDVLASQFPDARWDQPIRGPLADLGALLLTGSISLSLLATTIVRLSCHVRKRGLMIDLRRRDILVTEVPGKGPGYLLVIAADGRHELVDVCVEAVDLAGMLAAIRPADPA